MHATLAAQVPTARADTRCVFASKLIESRIRELHPLSESARAILELTGDPEHSIQDLAAIIETDGPLTIRVLNVVNSAAFAIAEKIQAISHAVVYLGPKTVVTIALSFSASELFGDRSKQVAGLWEDGVRTALAARLLASNSPVPIDPALAYTGGLIRDIGRSVLWPLLKNGAGDLQECISAGRAADLLAAERATTGTDHCEVGGRVAEHFELSDSLVDLVRHHHDPASADPELRDVVDLVHVADSITAGFPVDGGSAPPVGLEPTSAERIGFGITDLGWLCAALEEEYEAAAALLEIGRA